MFRRALVPLLLILACRGSDSHARAPSGDTLDMDAAPLDSLDSVLTAPRLLNERAVVVFWTRASDTLHPDDAASAMQDLNYYTEQITEQLKTWNIALVLTNSDTVYMALPNNRRRPIVLQGLEYPFGYLLVDPEGPERLLSGVYADDELLEEIRAYFDLPEDTASGRPRVTT
jgi:hypothetical protein